MVGGNAPLVPAALLHRQVSRNKVHFSLGLAYEDAAADQSMEGLLAQTRDNPDIPLLQTAFV